MMEYSPVHGWHEKTVVKLARPVVTCDLCGLPITPEQIDTGKARRFMVLPDSEFSAETWETFHVDCEGAK